MYMPPKAKVRLNPQWRWQRAIELVMMDRVSLAPEDDRSIVSAYDFLRRLRRAGQDPETQRLVRDRYPSIYDAHILYREGGRLRHAVEALLLVGIAIRDIARVLVLEPAVVRAFRDIWFDVPIGEEGQVRVPLSLVPEAYRDGFDATDTDGYWKVIARMRNFYRLANVMNVLAPLLTEEESFGEMLREALERKALEAALGAGWDEKAIQAVVRVLGEAQARGEGGNLPLASQQALYEALTGFKWHMACDKRDEDRKRTDDSGPPDEAARRRGEGPTADD